MGPGRSSVLRIGSNLTEASSSRRADRGNDSLAMVVHRAADSCHGRVSGINKICFLYSSYCRSQATAA